MENKNKKNDFKAINIFVGLLILAFFGLYVYKAEAQVGTTAVRVSNSPTVFIAPAQTINTVATGTTPVSIASTVSTTQATIAGTVSAYNKNVSTTATRCTVSGGAPSAARKRVCFTNTSTGIDCYIGGVGMTALTGFLLRKDSGNTLCFERDSSDFYCLCASSPAFVGILEVN